jgi:23S rRNA (cytidine1920-2'-O)/16S rRNA (cytidine1409-2'-O)-methyltransferase
VARAEDQRRFVSRAGIKLDHALASFGIDATGWVCADFGANAGGFTDCLLQRGVSRVYAIDTGYGALDWKLRKDARVVVMERTNAMHASLPEPVDLVVIDVAWTKQTHILPAARRVLKPTGQVVTLIKPHYEAEASQRVKGILRDDCLDSVVTRVAGQIASMGLEVKGIVQSPIVGTGGNRELLAWLGLPPAEATR